MARIVLNLVLQVLIAVVLTLLLAGLYFWLILGVPPAEAFFDQAVRLGLGFTDVGVGVWAILLVVGAVRERGLGWGVGGSFLAALIGVAVNLVWIIVISSILGGADIFAVALGVQAGVCFVIAAVASTLIVRRGIRAKQ